MATGRELVKKILQKAGVVTKNEAPSADETNDTLDALNNMISSWANNSLLVYVRNREDFTLSGGVEAYTIGSGADFDTDRPVQILDAYISTGSVKYQTLSIVPDKIYQRYIVELGTTGIPLYLNYDNNYPTGTIRLYPKPSTDYTLTLLSEKPLTSVTLDDDVSFPPGWERALIYNCALEVSGEFGTDMRMTDVQIAKESLGSIKKAVAKNTMMDGKPITRTGSFNVYRGW